MEYGKISSMQVGDVAKGVAYEGGAVIAGLLGAGILGKQVEKFVKVATPASTMLDKALAYAGNNVPKIAAYYIVRKEGGKLIGADLAKDVGKGILGSVVLDTLIRSGNDFAPGTTFKLFGFDVMSESAANAATPQVMENMQRVLQENSALRQQLNSTLQKLASASQIQTSFPPDHDRQYGMMQSTPEAENRRKNFGAMTPPIEDERNRKYGAMNKAQLNFAGETDTMAATFGML